MWWQWAIGLVSGVVLLWLALMAALWFARPSDDRLRESIRLLPDVVRLLTRLARDSTLPLGVRLRLWALLCYLAVPIDLIPDFIPVIGYADDAILVCFALRSVVRRAGRPALVRHWPGSESGLAAVERLARIDREPDQTR